MIDLCLSAAFSILNVIGAIYDLNGKEWCSKEDTNDNHLNNWRLARQRLTNLQHSLKRRQNRDVSNDLIRSMPLGRAYAHRSRQLHWHSRCFFFGTSSSASASHCATEYSHPQTLRPLLPAR
jgi:hypothetical protein